MVVQGSCPSLSAFLEDVIFLSIKDGGYVIVSYIFQSTEKWPQIVPISVYPTDPDGTRTPPHPPIRNYCSAKRFDFWGAG